MRLEGYLDRVASTHTTLRLRMHPDHIIASPSLFTSAALNNQRNASIAISTAQLTGKNELISVAATYARKYFSTL